MTRPITRLGVPVATMLVVAIMLAALWPAQRGFAFEDLVEPLIKARSARCKMIARMPGLPAFNMTAMFRGSLSRQESPDMGTVMIADGATGTFLSLELNAKQARILQALNYDPQRRSPLMSGNGDILQMVREHLLELREDKRITRQSLGERELGGRTLIGYKITAPGIQMDIWGDRETGLPHTIDVTMAAFPGMNVTVTEFEFDVELDDGLFRLTPPAGYTVTKDTMDVSPPTEADFVAALGEFAQLNGGAFPDEISMVAGIKISASLQVKQALAPTPEGEAEVNRVRKLFARCFSFPLMLPKEAEAAYAGRNVKQGDGDIPIFWYRPEGAEAYRIVRADLTVVDSAEPPSVEGAQQFGEVK